MPHFNLETAIATWRQFHERLPAFSADDLDELERHLRDHIARLMAAGEAEAEAFRQASQQVGDIAGGATEYKKVQWDKLRRTRGVAEIVAWQAAMLRNYLTTAVRNLQRHPGFAFINIAGLALGMACCLLLLHYAQHEFSFDRFHSQHNQIYRAATQVVQPERGTFPLYGATGHQFGVAMSDAVPAIEHVARIQPNFGYAVVAVERPAGTQVFRETRAMYADSTFLRMFDFPVEQGDRQQALTEPGTVWISSTIARKYFGDDDPIGQTLAVTAWVRGDFTVAGVFADVPPNSHLQFDMLLPTLDLLALWRYNHEAERGWDRRNFATYVQLRPGAEVAAAEAQMTETFVTQRREALAARNRSMKVHLQPLTDIRLNAAISAPASHTGDKRAVWIGLAIGLVTLLLALINYVNLATARALDRSREIGVRKVVGAHPRQLIRQFLLESALVLGVALVAAVALAALCAPLVNDLIGTNLPADLWRQPLTVWMLGLLAVVGPLVAGGYPAIVLSAFRPAQVLKGSGAQFGHRPRLRQGLVIAQFAVTFVLLTSTVVIHQQVQHMQDLDTGLDLDNVMVIERPRVRVGQGFGEGEVWTGQQEAFKAALLQLPGVEHVGGSTTTPGRGFNYYTPIFREGDAPNNGHRARSTNIDHDFIDAYGLSLLAGEPFRPGTPLSDAEEPPALLNETAVRALGYASNADAVGQRIENGRGEHFTIQGVVSDFRWSSAHDPAEAVVFLYETRYGDFSLKMGQHDLAQTLDAIQGLYERHFPGNPFIYLFADMAFDAQYAEDQQQASLFSTFTGLAVFIACLGLFGLAAFTTERRTKEIGVRKVLGASVLGLVALMAREFVLLLLVAFALAVPAAYVIMQRWLESFAYRIDLGFGLFVGIAGLVLVVALLTVSYQSIKSALADPVESLRYE
ncbi:MAG: ABC transporter permease [Rhodothermales bacterium]